MTEETRTTNRIPRFEPARASDPAVVAVEDRQRVLLSRLEQGRRAEAALHAERLLLLAEFAETADELAALLHPDRLAEARDMQRRSMTAEVAVALNVSERFAQIETCDAETIAALPATLDALATGDISRQHVHKLVVHLNSLPSETWEAYEAAVLPAAMHLTPARFDNLARRTRERLHPDSLTIRAHQAREERSAWITEERDGMAHFHLLATAENVLAIDARLHHHARALAAEPGETRTLPQLRADAAVDLLLGHPATAGGAAVELMVTVPATTLAGAGEEPGELSGYGPIDPDTARRLAAAAPALTRVLTRPDTGEIVSVGRASYRLPAALRRRLRVEDERCRFPGCNRRAITADADHTTAWEDGGGTDIDNLAHLCRRHHRLKHATDWDVAQDPDRTLAWISPLGQVAQTRPPGRDMTDATERARAILRRARDSDPAGTAGRENPPPPTRENSPPRTSTPEPDDGPAMTARGREVLARIRTPRPLPEHAPF
ncbi:HNH endonuclease [Humibacter sp. BT305]|nr:HNH endonuclease [Humibacter sp. BT305]